MVSAEAAWSSGATGIACDADIAARPTPTANKDAARNFIDLPFPVRRNTIRDHTKIEDRLPKSSPVTAPVPVAPMTSMPMAVTPAPVTTVPMPVPMAVPMPVVAPTHFFRLETIDLLLPDDGGFRCFAKRGLRRRDRRQHCGLRARGQRSGARNKSNAESEKVPAFHGIHPLHPVKDQRSFAGSK